MVKLLLVRFPKYLQLEHDERYVRLLYHTMKAAISARAEFFLQGKAKQFEQALESLGYEELKELKHCLSEQSFSAINIEEAAISNLRKKLAQNLPNSSKCINFNL